MNIEHFNYSGDMHFKSANLHAFVMLTLIYVLLFLMFPCFIFKSHLFLILFFYQTPWTLLDDNEWVMR